MTTMPKELQQLYDDWYAAWTGYHDGDSKTIVLIKAADLWTTFDNQAKALASICGVPLRDRFGLPYAEFPAQPNAEAYGQKLQAAGWSVYFVG